MNGHVSTVKHKFNEFFTILCECDGKLTDDTYLEKLVDATGAYMRCESDWNSLGFDVFISNVMNDNKKLNLVEFCLKVMINHFQRKSEVFDCVVKQAKEFCATLITNHQHIFPSFDISNTFFFELLSSLASLSQVSIGWFIEHNIWTIVVKRSMIQPKNSIYWHKQQINLTTSLLFKSLSAFLDSAAVKDLITTILRDVCHRESLTPNLASESFSRILRHKDRLNAAAIMFVIQSIEDTELDDIKFVEFITAFQILRGDHESLFRRLSMFIHKVHTLSLIECKSLFNSIIIFFKHNSDVVLRKNLLQEAFNVLLADEFLRKIGGCRKTSQFFSMMRQVKPMSAMLFKAAQELCRTFVEFDNHLPPMWDLNRIHHLKMLTMTLDTMMHLLKEHSDEIENLNVEISGCIIYVALLYIAETPKDKILSLLTLLITHSSKQTLIDHLQQIWKSGLFNLLENQPWKVQDSLLGLLSAIISKQREVQDEALFRFSATCVSVCSSLMFCNFVRASAVDLLCSLTQSSSDFWTKYVTPVLGIVCPSDYLYEGLMYEKDILVRREMADFCRKLCATEDSKQQLLLRIIMMCLYDYDWEVQFISLEFWESVLYSILSCTDEHQILDQLQMKHVLKALWIAAKELSHEPAIFKLAQLLELLRDRLLKNPRSPLAKKPTPEIPNLMNDGSSERALERVGSCLNDSDVIESILDTTDYELVNLLRRPSNTIQDKTPYFLPLKNGMTISDELNEPISKQQFMTFLVESELFVNENKKGDDSDYETSCNIDEILREIIYSADISGVVATMDCF